MNAHQCLNPSYKVEISGVWTSRPVSGVLSRPRTKVLIEGDHPSATVVTNGLMRPTSRHRAGRSSAQIRPKPNPLGLAPGGVCQATSVTRCAGGLLHHRFTLTGLRRRSVLCGTVPRVSPGGRYPPPCPVVPRLSSTHQGAPRSPGRLVRHEGTPVLPREETAEGKYQGKRQARGHRGRRRQGECHLC
jgi:hypothetical protein